MDNNTNFYISGFLSLGLFTILIFLFTMLLFNPNSSKTFALKKDNFISISLVTSKVEVPVLEKKEFKNPIDENIDINNLFSDVWAKKITHKKDVSKPRDSKRLLEIQKKLKTASVNNVKPISKRETKETKQNSTADEVNEYLAKIQAIVYQYFRVPLNSQGSSVKTVIELNSLGKVLDFRVLNYSKNEALNEEANKIKKRLMYVTFPQNPENKTSRTIVILISKE